ncbi:MAG: tetratricopeptide repeat protein [Planctomycetes bacterium]|nr:tetratricopeptide repeat protein [Planctomycetota bacterium]
MRASPTAPAHRLAILLALLAPLGPLALRAEDAEDRLVAAELLEVSSGDLERAMAVYKALAAEEAVPEVTRARALLALGRCQRKLGQLEAAKKTLEDLVKTHAKEGDVLRQAQSFLREITSGRAESPDFDWIREIEKSPEIQARVFDWAMELVSVPSNEDPPAGRRLLALGTIALPVLERVLDASRDPAHRLHLATIAVRVGKLERLAMLVDPADAGNTYHLRIRRGIEEILERLPALALEERKKALEAIASVPRSPATDPLRFALELAARDTRDLARKLESLEKSWLHQQVIYPLAEREAPGALEAMAARAAEKGCPLDVRLRYLDILLEKAPEKLPEGHWRIVEERAAEIVERNEADRHTVPRYVEKLEALGRFDALRDLAGGNAGLAIVEVFETRYVKPKKLAQAPGAWGAVLRAARLWGDESFPALHLLAERNDEAAAEFAGFLRAKEAEWPTYRPYGERPDKAWTPSPRYAELMAGLLDSQDPVVLAIALEALAIAPKGADPEALPALERLVLAPPDLHVREYAVYCLLQRLAARPEAAGDASRILLEDWRRRRGQMEQNEESPLQGVQKQGRIGHQHVQRSRRGHEDHSMFGPYAIGWALDAVDKRAYQRLHGAALAAELKEGDQDFLDWVRRLLPKGSAELQDLEPLRGLALNAKVHASVRAWAVRTAGDAGKGWLDWRKLIEAGDMLLIYVHVDDFAEWFAALDSKEQDPVLEALAKSPEAHARHRRLELYPRTRPEYPEVLLKALEDPDEGVQSRAARALLEVDKLPGPELYARLLEHPVARRADMLFPQIASSADPRMIEPLVKLLDDRDESVRKGAIETLKAIKAVLAERDEWRAILQAAKEQRAVKKD